MEDFSSREQRQSFYLSEDWRNLREYVLSTEPFCRICKGKGKIKAALVVDHIIDIKDNPSTRLDIDNLQPLCIYCHNKKTAIKTTESKKEFYKTNPTGIHKRKWNCSNTAASSKH